MRTHEGYAIVRVDKFLDDSAPYELKIKVKRVVWTEEAAKVEVERLNKVNTERHAQYFWQSTKVDELAP